MTRVAMWKYALAWLPMVVIAIINGSLRQYVYGPYMSELAAHQVSTVTGIFLFGIYIGLLIRYLAPDSRRQAWMIGFMWLGMTVVFEFIFGHYVMDHSWSHLLHDYNLFAGRVWLLVLLWTTVAPILFYRLQRR